MQFSQVSGTLAAIDLARKGALPASFTTASAQGGASFSATKIIFTPPVDSSRDAGRDNHGHRESHPVKGGHAFHRGTDYATPTGTPLTAPADAIFRTGAPIGGYGKWAALRIPSNNANGDGDIVMFSGHLSRNANGLKDGDPVKQGTVFAFTGATGDVTGPHLHHELWIKKNGVYYTVNDQLAAGKDLKDPNVQNMLIEDAISKGRKTVATVANIIEFRDQRDIMTARAQTDRTTGTAPTLTPVV
jgi:murein DD-endopeptidase MepM/ murein hydrolase activator NlpD